MKQLRLILSCSAAMFAIGVFGAGAAQAASEEPTLPIPVHHGSVNDKSREVPEGSEHAPKGATPFSSSQCASNYFCLWSDAYYGGYVWSVSGTNGTWAYVGAGTNDVTSSIWNRRGWASWVDKDYPAKGDYACIGAGWSYENLNAGPYGPKWWEQDGTKVNDSISSYWIPEINYHNCSEQPQIAG